MEVKCLRDLLYEDICDSSRIRWVSLDFESCNEQNILIEVKDGTKFQIIVIETDRCI